MKKTNQGRKAGGALSLRHISELIAYGEITVGEKFPMGCVAVAHDGHNSVAMLRRRKRESLIRLLIRLRVSPRPTRNKSSSTKSTPRWAQHVDSSSHGPGMGILNDIALVAATEKNIYR
jgi:hypothetical protein